MEIIAEHHWAISERKKKFFEQQVSDYEKKREKEKLRAEEYRKSQEKIKKEREEEIEKLKSILEPLGIEMNIWGCGCCGSPEVKIVYKGEVIINTSEFKIEMIEEDK